MKKKLNLICGLILVVLAVQVLMHFGLFALGVKRGLEYSEHEIPQMERAIPQMQSLHLLPNDLFAPTDTVTNLVSGERIPISYFEVYTICDTHMGLGAFLLQTLLAGLIVAGYVLALVALIRFVVRINRSEIFVWRNVKLLRRLGVYLCVSFIAFVGSAYMDCYAVSQSIALEGYDINWWVGLENTNLLLGLAALLIAEVFAIGLRLREEQELTI
jgi:hypothetical protein